MSFKPGAEADSRPSPAAPGQSPVKICWRTMAGKAAAPRPRPRCSGAGSLPSAPRPLPARLASWTDVPGEGATRARCPRPRRRGRAPQFSPQPRRQECETSFQSPPPPPQLRPWPGPPTSAQPASHSPGAAAPPPPETEEERTRRNYFRICNERAHTHTHLPSGLPSWPGQPRPADGLNAPRASQDLREAPTHTPLGVPRLVPCAASPRAIHTQTT